MHVFRPSHFVLSQEEMHSHRNHFASNILCGGFTHTLWEPCAADQSVEDDGLVQQVHGYTYDPLVHANGSAMFHIEPQGKMNVRLVGETSVTAGQV